MLTPLVPSSTPFNVIAYFATPMSCSKFSLLKTLKGVELGTRGVSIRNEGDFETLGKVYYSANTTANILSYAVMIDSGNSITYDQADDSFILKPKDSEERYISPISRSHMSRQCCRS